MSPCAATQMITTIKLWTKATSNGYCHSLKVKHKSANINMFSHATTLNPYCTIYMYLYKRDRLNKLVPSFVVYTFNHELSIHVSFS